MTSRSALGRAPRLVVAVALGLWIVVAAWILVLLVGAEPSRDESPFTAIGELLLPALLLGVLALIFVLVPRRLAGGWTIIFLFALLGLPAWLMQRHAAYAAVPWVQSAVVTATVWMCLGLALGLIALSLLALRGVPEPADVHVAAQFTGSPTRPHAEQVSGAGPLVERDPPSS